MVILKFAPKLKETHSFEAQKVQKQLFKHICMDIMNYNLTY